MVLSFSDFESIEFFKYFEAASDKLNCIEKNTQCYIAGLARKF